MSGTIPRTQIADAHFQFRADGCETATKTIMGPLGDLDQAYWIRPAFDPLFTPMGSIALEGDDPGAVQDILTSAGLWDASWAAYTVGSGGDYLAHDGNHYQGGAAISQRMDDFLATTTDKDAENAVKTQYWVGVIIPKIQARGDLFFGGYAAPPPPAAPPTVVQLYPPAKIGGIHSAIELGFVEGMLMTTAVDPANGNRVVYGMGAVPG